MDRGPQEVQSPAPSGPEAARLTFIEGLDKFLEAIHAKGALDISFLARDRVSLPGSGCCKDPVSEAFATNRSQSEA